MKKLLLVAFFMACAFVNKAQTPNWLWAESGMGNGYGYCSDIAIGPNDTVYIAGRTGGNLSLGGLTLNTGNTIPFVGKYDSSGATNNNGVWLSDQYPVSSFAYSDALCVDNAGSSYITSCDGSGGSVFIQKYNRNGNSPWTKDYSGGNCRGYGISVDNMGNVYSSGNISGAMNLGAITLPYSGGSWGGYLIKQDTAGNVKWATYFTSSGNFVGGRRCANDMEGNTYVVGSYKGAAQFYNADLSTYITAPTATASSSLGDLFVVKYDSSGTAQWVLDVPNAGVLDNMYYYANTIVTDSCGNLYVGGIFDGTATFGSLPPVTATGQWDAYIAKFNTHSMTWEWVQTVDGSGGTNIYCGNITLDKTSDVYICGSYNSSSISFGASNTISGGNNFIAKYSNSNGAVQFVINANISNGGISGVAADSKNYLYVDGSYNGTSTLGSATLTGGSGSVFIAKLDTIPPRIITPKLDTIYCSQGSITFTTIGTFNQGNIFTVQLSDSTGSFADAIDIGYDTSTTGGVVNITIPGNIPNGNTYLIRIVSSSPGTSSWANGCGAYYAQNVYLDNFYVSISRGATLNVTLTPSNNVAICGSTPVTLKAYGGSSNDSYLWSTGATNDSIIVNPSVDTTYSVNIIGGCGSVDTAFHVSVNADTITIQPQFPTLCDGSTISLTVPSSGLNYTWSPSSGLNQSTGDSVVANPTATITYTLTGTNSSGCSVTDSDIITVTSPIIPPTIKQHGDTLISSASQGNTWTLGGNTLTNFTDSSIIITQSGCYQVTATNSVNGCSATSDTDCVTAGIVQLAVNIDQISIYPNPTNGTVNVNIKVAANELSGLSLQITDVLGRTLYTQQSLNYTNTIDVSPLASGVYFVSILNTKGRTVLPLIKQN